MKTTEKMKDLYCVAEVKMSYRRDTGIEQKEIRTSKDVYDMAVSLYDKDVLDYCEQCYVLLLNQAGKVNGYRKVAEGGMSAASVDIRQIMQAALLTNSCGIAMIHNHPSGNLVPSRQDDNLTRVLQQACQFFDMNLIDHVIVTSEGYYSYADHGRI